MAYPPAPGTGTGSGTSLPAKPPTPAGAGGFSNTGSPSVGTLPKKGGFKPAFSSPAPPSLPQQPPGAYSLTPPTTYGPSAPPPARQHGPSYPSYGGGAPGAVNQTTYSQPQSQPQQQSQNWWQNKNGRGQQPAVQAQPTRYNQTQQSYGPQSHGPQSHGPSYSYAAPQIRNPFTNIGPVGGAEAEYGPDMAAQIAQWQSAYVSPALDSDGKPIEQPKPEVVGPTVNPNANAANANPDKKQTVVREGGGKKWTDESLLEWDPSHLRLFVGNLAGETTDDSLLKAFSRWKSVQRARVIREKRTTKSKGFGFVSFSDADDFFQAAKEMNGKYIQSHPVVVRKANTEIKVSNVKDKNKRNNYRNSGDKKKSGGYEANLGPTAGGGVTKPGQKTKNGLRLLG